MRTCASLATVAFIVIPPCAAFSLSSSLLAVPKWLPSGRGVVAPHPPPSPSTRLPRATAYLFRATPTPAPTASLSMGLFDFIQSNFLDSRDGDFVPLDSETDDVFGPGPLLLAYAVPPGLDDAELGDMVEDGMPDRRGGVAIRRLEAMDEKGEGGDALLDLTVGEALDAAMAEASKSEQSSTKPLMFGSSRSSDGPCPVLYFSGVTNTEMMDTYNIVANEIYEETGGVHWPACAKAVPPAASKMLRQVIEEISGDHADAMRMRREEQEKFLEGGVPGMDVPL